MSIATFSLSSLVLLEPYKLMKKKEKEIKTTRIPFSGRQYRPSKRRSTHKPGDRLTICVSFLIPGRFLADCYLSISLAHSLFVSISYPLFSRQLTQNFFFSFWKASAQIRWENTFHRDSFRAWQNLWGRIKLFFSHFHGHSFITRRVTYASVDCPFWTWEGDEGDGPSHPSSFP